MGCPFHNNEIEQKTAKEAVSIEKTSHSISYHSASNDIIDQFAWTYEISTPLHYFPHFIYCDFSIY